MATTAKIAKDLKLGKIQLASQAAKAQGKPGIAKHPTRHRNRCWRCGRPRAFLRKFGICRLCFRQLALEGDIAGVTKSSW